MGLGVALGQQVLARTDLEAGRLIALSPVSVRLGHPYCAFIPDAKAERADIQRLLTLLGNSAPPPG
jgi:LysR family glycine cleavage system transcriptional activator